MYNKKRGFCNGSATKNLPARKRGFHPWVRKILWSREWQPIQYSCLKNTMDRCARAHTDGTRGDRRPCRLLLRGSRTGPGCRQSQPMAAGVPGESGLRCPPLLWPLFGGWTRQSWDCRPFLDTGSPAPEGPLGTTGPRTLCCPVPGRAEPAVLQKRLPNSFPTPPHPSLHPSLVKKYTLIEWIKSPTYE